MENKKISFGFSKSTKKQNIFQKADKPGKKIELIECLEAQTIKIKDAVEKIKKPLVIPMIQSSGNILDRRRELKIKQEGNNVVEKPDSELSIDELAARELIREAQNSIVKGESKIFALSTTTENVIEIEGKPESTLDDYESVPISDFGKAMLRGMGWKEGMGIGKNQSAINVAEPELRPKGMGLGANKNRNEKQVEKPRVDQNGKALILEKGGFVKIINGKQKGNYCEVQGFDDESGRVIVKTAIDKRILSLNEFLIIPVSKEEYVKSSKILNLEKYEDYKNKSVKQETSSTSTTDLDLKPNQTDEDYKNNDHHRNSHKKNRRSRSRRASSCSSRESNSESNHKEHKRRSSSESDHRRKEHKNKKNKKDKHRHRYNNDSDSDSKYYKSKERKSHKHKHHSKDR